MFTRDMIQGFIDGYVTAGGDPSAVADSISQYMENHPTYKAEASEIDSIKTDVQSYRLTTQVQLAPTPVPSILSVVKP